MVELRITLGYEAVAALMSGTEIGAEVDGEDLVVVIGLAPAAIERFRDEAQKALLHYMPAAGPPQ